MGDHVERMKKEYHELRVKADALAGFIYSNEIFKTLEIEEQARMSQQLGFMRAYQQVLDQRLWAAHKNG